MRCTTIMADEETLRWLREIARREDRSLADVIREALERRAARPARAGTVALIVGTGLLPASIDGADPDHAACGELPEGAGGGLVVPAPMPAEVAWPATARLEPLALDHALVPG